MPPGIPALPAVTAPVKTAAPKFTVILRPALLTWDAVDWAGVQYVVWHSLDLTNWVSLGRFGTNQYSFWPTNGAEFFRVQSLDPDTLLVSPWATAP